MPVFFLFEVKEITDDNLYRQYNEKAKPINSKYRTRLILILLDAHKISPFPCLFANRQGFDNHRHAPVVDRLRRQF